MASNYCPICGARQGKRLEDWPLGRGPDGFCGSPEYATILVNGEPHPDFAHIFRVEGSPGYCEDCGRNSISCECHWTEEDDWPDAYRYDP